MLICRWLLLRYIHRLTVGYFTVVIDLPLVISLYLTRWDVWTCKMYPTLRYVDDQPLRYVTLRIKHRLRIFILHFCILEVLTRDQLYTDILNIHLEQVCESTSQNIPKSLFCTKWTEPEVYIPPSCKDASDVIVRVCTKVLILLFTLYAWLLCYTWLTIYTMRSW